MASRYCHLLLFFFFFILLSISPTSAYTTKTKQYKPCNQLVLYFHEVLYNGKNWDNSTAVISSTREGFTRLHLADKNHFGNMIVFDNPITIDNNFHSPAIGRAQGMYLYDSKDTLTAWFGLSFVFNSTEHQGSINFSGADPILVKTREISIVSGTGDFFMHRGIATLSTDAYESEVYYRLKVDIKFYECW